ASPTSAGASGRWPAWCCAPGPRPTPPSWRRSWARRWRAGRCRRTGRSCRRSRRPRWASSTRRCSAPRTPRASWRSSAGRRSARVCAMRFATIRTDQGTTAARLDGDVLTPLQAGDVGAMLAAGERAGAPPVPAAQADFAPVVTQPGKVICVGLNYRSHILETGRELPEYPTLFAKFAETLMGSRDDLVLPSVSERVDWEVELGVVIGRPVYRATPEEASAAIAGYTVINDVSMR